MCCGDYSDSLRNDVHPQLLNHFLTDREVQLTSRCKTGSHKLYVRELHLTVIALRVEEIH